MRKFAKINSHVIHLDILYLSHFINCTYFIIKTKKYINEKKCILSAKYATEQVQKSYCIIIIYYHLYHLSLVFSILNTFVVLCQ